MSERISAVLAREALAMLSDDSLRALLSPHTVDPDRESAERAIRAISPPGACEWSMTAEDRRVIAAAVAGDRRGTEGMNRAKVGETVDGWQQVGLPCMSGRRSLWVRFSPGLVELCSGRDGDDSYAVITDRNPVYGMVRDVLADAAYAASGEV